jgi:YD repeat-containing protein
MTSAANLRTQLTGLYVMLLNRSPDYDGLHHWSKAITAGTHQPVNVAQALLESDAGRAAYPASMSNADFVSKLYQQVLGRAPDAAGLANWSARIQVAGRAQTTVELAMALTDYASFDPAALTSQWLFNNKVTQSLAGLQTAARQAVTAAGQQSAIAAQLATVNLTTSTQPAASAVKVNTTTYDNRRPQVTLQVDRWGNVISMTDARSGNWVTRYTYNAGNNITSIIDADGKSLFYTYDQLGRQLSATDGNGNINGKRYDTLGRVVQHLQADGGIVTSQYDAFGQRIRLRQANGVLTDYAYDHLGHVNRVSQAAVMGVDVYRSQTDSVGAVPRLVLQSHQALTETSRYDELGRRIQVTAADGAVTKLYYDLRGNLTHQVDALGKTTRSTYDRFDHKTVQERPDGKKLRWTYLADGNIATHTDLSGTQLQYRYNQLRQVTDQSTVTVSAGHAAQNLVFSYDNSSGLLTKIVDRISGQVTRYAYDLAGNRTREKTSIESNGRQTKVLQDNHITYDRLGRMTRVADSRYVATFEYDANGNRKHQTVAYIDDNNASRSIDLWNDYDSMNRQTVVDGKKINGAIGIDASGGQQIAYDNAGNRIAVRQWGSQLSAQLREDERGSYTEWSNSDGMVQETYRYDAAGRLSKTLRDGLETDTRKYDAAGRTMGTGSSALQEQASTYRSNLADALSQAGVQADVYTNTYNAGGQLIHQGVKDIGGVDKSGMQLTGYDAAGNLLQYTLWQAQVGKQTSTYSYTYDHFDSSQVSSITVVRGDKTATTVNAFDGRGQLTSVTSTDIDRKVTLRSLSNNAEGQVLEKVEEGRKTRSLLVNDELLGSSAAQADGKITDTFAANYEPVSAASLSNAPTSYRVQKGQTLQSIAKAVWGDANLWYLIADANGVSTVKEGDLITIPTRVNTVRNDYQTYRPYDASSVIGDITPTLPMPAADQGCGAMGQVLMLAVAVIVTVYSAGAMTSAATGFMEIMQAGAATLANNIPVAAAAGAAGSMASQFVGNVIGAQDGFSLQQIGLAALGSAAAAGIGQAMEPVSETVTGWERAATLAGRSAMGNAVSQGVGVLTGLQKEFSWRGVAAAAVGAGMANGVTQGLEGTAFAGAFGQLGVGTASGFIGGLAAAAVRGGGFSATQVAVDAFGNALGNSIVNNSWQQSQSEMEMQRQEDMRNAAMFDALSGVRLQFDSPTSAQPFNVYATNSLFDEPYDVGPGRATAKGFSLSRDPGRVTDGGVRGNVRITRIDFTGEDISSSLNTNDILNQSEAYARSESDRLIARYPAPANIALGATGEVRAIGAMEGFFIFDKPGQILKGVGAGLKAPVDMLVGAGDLVSDVYGFASRAITETQYEAQSGFLRSIQSQGIVATAGDLFANTVKSLPGIAQINSLYHNDLDGLGQSLPGLIGTAGSLKVLSNESFVAKNARVSSEVSALERIAINNQVGTSNTSLSQAYQQAKGQLDFGHIEADVTFTATGKVKAQGGHFSASPNVQIVAGTESTYVNGVINAQVKVADSNGAFYMKNNSKNGMSTLTPNTWTVARAKGEMSVAFLNRSLGPDGRWYGVSSGVDFLFNGPQGSVKLWRGFPIEP